MRLLAYTLLVALVAAVAATTTCNDLDVGTKSGVYNVIAEGAVQPEWDEGHRRMVVGTQIARTTFFVRRGSASIGKALVASSSTAAEPVAYEEGHLGQQLEEQLTIVFNCQRAGATEVTVSFPLGHNDFASFSFAKLCGEVPEGLQVGTSPGGRDVVSDGASQRDWQFVAQEESQTTLYVQRNYASAPLSYAHLVSTSTNDNVLATRLVGELTLGRDIGDKPTSVSVEYECLDEGAAEVIVEMRFAEASELSPVEVSWLKVCGPEWRREPEPEAEAEPECTPEPTPTPAPKVACVYGMVVHGACYCVPGYKGAACNVSVVVATPAPVAQNRSVEVVVEEAAEEAEEDAPTSAADACTPACVHGRCANATCVCDDGFTGAACDLEFCDEEPTPVPTPAPRNVTVAPNATAPNATTPNVTRRANHTGCPANCHGHGECTAAHTCACELGYHGEACERVAGALNVGTREDAADVVAESEVTMAWDITRTANVMPAAALTTTFYLRAAPVHRPFVTVDVVPIGKPTITATPAGVMEPRIVVVPDEANATCDGVLTDGKVEPLVLEYNCIGTGVAYVTVSVPLGGTLTPTDQVVSWTYRKMCSTKMPGLRVGTSPAQLTNVVRDGEVQPLWYAPTRRNVVPPNEHTSRFFFSKRNGTGAHEINAPSVSCEPADACTVTLDGLVAGGCEVCAQEVKTLEVEYHCNDDLPQLVTVHMALNLGPNYERVETAFYKVCGAVPLAGLEMGSAPTQSDVVADGKPVEEWSLHEPTDAESTTFHLWRMLGEEGTVEPALNISNVRVSALERALRVNVRGSALHRSLPVGGDVRTLTLDYECLRGGTHDVTLEIDVYPWATVSLSWRKDCVARHRRGLTVGTAANVMDVMQDGVALPAFARAAPTAEFGVDVTTNKLWVWMYNNTGNQHVEFAVHSSDRSIAQPDVRGAATTVERLSRVPAALLIDHNCVRADPVRITVDMNVKDSLTGATFKSSSFAYTTLCGGLPRLGLNIGTCANASDVVESGTVRAAWSAANHTFLAASDDAWNAFYVSLATAAVGDAENITSVHVHADPPILQPVLSYPTSITADDAEVRVDYHCRQPGRTTVTMTLGLGLWQAVSVTWRKACGGSHRYGFQVGTAPHRPDIVHNGHVRAPWNGDDRDALVVAPRGSTEMTMFTWIKHETGCQVMAAPTVTVDPPILRAQIVGGASVAGVLDQYVQELTVAYKCTSVGVATVSLTLHADLYEPMTIEWEKRCYGKNRVGFNLASHNENGYDIIKDGIARAAWRPNAATLPVVPANVPVQHMYAWLYDGCGAAAQEVESFELTTSPAGVADPVVSGVAGLDGGAVVTREGMPVNVDHRCTAEGTTVVTMTVHFEVWRSATIAWVKECGGNTRQGIEVRTGANTTVVERGVAVGAWLDGTAVVRDDVAAFRVAMLNGSLAQMHAAPNVTCEPRDVCAPVARGPAGMAGAFGEVPQPLLVEHRCTRVARAQVTAAYELEGGFAPLRFAYTKECRGTARHGLMVGRAPGGQDVVQHGHVWPDYGPDLHLSHAFVDVDGDHVAFWMSLLHGDDPVHVLGASVSSRNDAIVTPTLHSLHREGGVLAVGAEWLYTLKLQCNAHGRTAVTLRIELDLYDALEITLNKACGGEARDGFTVSTRPFMQDVVRDGEETPEWRASGGVVVDALTDNSTFFLQMVNGTTNYTYAYVTAAADNVLSAYVDAGGRGGHVGHVPTPMVVRWNCTGTGASEVTVHVVIDLYKTAEWTLRKECGGGVRPGFIVGSYPHADDIVADGVLRAAGSGSGSWAPFTAGADATRTSFFVGVTTAPNLVHLVRPRLTASSDACTGTLSGAAWDELVAGNTSRALHVDYACRYAGDVVFTLTMQPETFAPIDISWTKHSSVAAPLRITTTRADSVGVVVADAGVTSDAWRAGNGKPLPAVASATADAVFSLLASGAEDVAVSGVSVAAYPPTGADPSVDGAISFAGGAVAPAFATELAVAFNCRHEGKVQVSVTVELERYNDITFSMEKSCGRMNRPGFMVGTSARAIDVAHNGEATPAWSALTHTVLAHSYETTTRLWLRMGKEAGVQRLGAPTVHASPAAVATPRVEGAFAVADAELTDAPEPVDVVYGCTRPGMTQITLTFPMELFDDVVLTWQKNCTGGHRFGLDIGRDEPHTRDVVRDGAQRTDVAHPVVPPTADMALFYATMHADEGRQAFEGATVTAQPAGAAEPQLLGETSGVLSAASTPLLVKVNCVQPGDVDVTVSLPLPGWRTTTFTFTAQCLGKCVPGVDAFHHDARIARDGCAVAGWSRDDHSHVVPTHEHVTPLRITSSAEAPRTTYTRANVTLCPQGVVEVDRDGFDGGELDRDGDELTLAWRCVAPGDVRVTVEMQMAGAFQPFVLEFTKRCDYDMDGFHVGLQPNTHDVVQDGAPTTPWNSVDHSYKACVDDVSTSFFLHLAPDAGHAAFAAPRISVFPQIAVPSLSGEAARGGDADARPQELVVEYNCAHAGTAVVNVEVELTPYHTVSWTWTKECADLVYGVNVGLTPTATDVIKHGATLTAWQLGSHAIYIGVNDEHTTFHVHMTPGTGTQVFGQPMLIAQPSDVAAPVLSGAAAQGGVASSVATPLRVDYHCAKSGELDITIQIPLDGHDSLRWAYKKLCDVGHPAAMVGTEPARADVIVAGKLNDEFADFSTPATELRTPFYVFAAGGSGAIPIGAAHVEADSTVALPMLMGELLDVDTLTTNSTEVEVVYRCQTAGPVDVTVTVEVPLYNDLVWTWTHMCGSYGEIALDVATHPQADNVVSDGVTQHAWNVAEPVAHVGVHEDASTFWVGIHNNDGVGAVMTKVPQVSTCPEGVAEPTLSGDANNDQKYDEHFEDLHVTYNCVMRGDTKVTIVIPLADGRQIAWSFTKACNGTSDFMIGTTTNAMDVVRTGAPLPAWRHPTVAVGAHVLMDTFFVHTVNGETEYGQPTITATPALARPTLSGLGSVAGAAVPAPARPLVVYYNCIADGETVLRVETRLATGKLVHFTWRKQCEKPLGVVVGTQPGTRDVWNATHAQPAVALNTNTMVATAEETETTFFVASRNAQPVEVFAPRVVLSNPAIMRPEVVGAAAPGGVVSGNPLPLTIVYHCVAAGQSAVTVSADVKNSDHDVLFQYVKVCSAEAPIGFVVGTAANTDDVVSNGHTAEDWREETRVHMVDVDEASSTFYYASTEERALPYTAPVVTMDPADLLRISLSGPVAADGELTRDARELHVAYECVGDGLIALTATNSFDGFDEAVYSWTKRCSTTVKRSADADQDSAKPNGVNLTPPEMIALMLSVLLCVGYLVGILTNYALFGRRGVEMLPLVNSWRDFRRWATGKRNDTLY